MMNKLFWNLENHEKYFKKLVSLIIKRLSQAIEDLWIFILDYLEFGDCLNNSMN